MKKRILRRVSLLLSLLTLVASFGGVNVFADEAELAFDGATVRVEEGLVVYFTIEKAKLSGYDEFYMSYTKDGGKTVEVDSYIEIGGSYYFPCENIAAKEMGSKIKATLTAIKGTEVQTSASFEYSVSQYCYETLEDASAEQWEKSIAASLLIYGEEAQKYFNHQTENLVTADMTDAQKELAVKIGEAELTSVYQNQPKDSAVTITGATIEHGNKPRLVIQLAREVSDDTVNGLSVKAAWGDQGETVEESEFREIDGKFYVYFNDLTLADLSKTLTITVFRGRAPVSNTVKYSLASYAAEKKNDAETSAIALAMLGYCKAVEAMPEKGPCDDGHSLEMISDGYDLIEKCINCTYQESADAKVIAFTSAEASSSFTYDQSVAFNRGYDATANALKTMLPFAHNDPYFLIKTDNAVDLSEYSYIAVYAKSNADFSMGYQGGANQNLNHFEASVEWKSYVMNCSALTGSFGTTRINFKEKEKDDVIYINSIAFFKTEAEAKAYTGIAAGEFTLEDKIEKIPTPVSTVLSFGSSEDVNRFNWAQTLGEFTRGYDATEQALKITVTANHADPYFEMRGEILSDMTEYNYIAVYAKSNFNGRLRLNNTQVSSIRNFVASDEYTVWVFDCSEFTTALGMIRLDFPANTAGATLYINSMALFKTKAEAQAFVGVFE